VLTALNSFPPGSFGGMDGLHPQHILKMVDWTERGELGAALVEFVNLILADGVSSSVRSVFFEGRLFALSKPGGGLRRIAVGLTYRCLAAKIANRAATAKCATFLAPRQLVVGVKGRCETAVHADRSFITSCALGSALLKIDFFNAFNCIRRDCMLEPWR